MKRSNVRVFISIIMALVILATASPIFARPQKKKSYTSPPAETTEPAEAKLKVQFFNYDRSESSSTIYPEFKIVNTGTASVNIEDIKVRYYYTIDEERTQRFWCDWSNIGNEYVTGNYVKMASPAGNADYYLEIGFAAGAGTLSPGGFVEVQTRITNSYWTAYKQSDDYSFNPTATSYVDWDKVTAYISGNLAWGSEPAPVIQSKRVLGFTTYYYSGDKSSYNSMAANTSSIDEIATATHVTDGKGNITGLVPAEQVQYANNNNIIPMIMLGNEFSGPVAKELLESQVNRANLINNLTELMNANGYKGVNIDLEGVYYYDRDYYTTFISEVYSALKPLGYIVTVSVPAKTVDNPTNS